MRKIVLTGGGTAGHVTPNIALLPKLKQEGWDICYIGSHQGIEKELIEQQNIPYYGISSGKLRRYLSVQNLKDPFKVIKGFMEAYKVLRELRPKVVFSKGGYVTVPVVLAAYMLGIPVIIHESDITPGLANKIAMKTAKKVCVNFEETLQYVGDKGILTGSPIRNDLFNGDKKRGKMLCGFVEDKPVLLIMGGSLGSVKINQTLRVVLPHLIKQFNIIHICGKGNKDSALESMKGYKQFEYVGEELTHFFAIADIMLSRAGANALSEIVALRIPSVLIPLSQAASRGDQILNARSMKSRGYCEVVYEEELTPEVLVEKLELIYKNKAYYISTMEKNNQIPSIDKIVGLINDISLKS